MERLTHTSFPAIPLSQIADWIGAACPQGHENDPVTAACNLEPGISGGLTFLAQAKYKKAVATSSASFLLAQPGQGDAFDGLVLKVADPYLAWAQCLAQIQATLSALPQVEPHIDPSARVSEGASIGHGVSIGADCVIHPGVVIYPGTQIGAHTIIHANAVIGSDGLGFAPTPGAPRLYHKIEHIGHVVIGDDVEIGAGTTVDRAVVGSTYIGHGTKIDNQCQIGHNVGIGEDCILAAQCGISGSTTLGRAVRVGGQAGLVGHIHIGDGASIGAQSGVAKDVAPGASVIGTPAIPAEQFKRQYVAQLLKRKKS